MQKRTHGGKHVGSGSVGGLVKPKKFSWAFKVKVWDWRAALLTILVKVVVRMRSEKEQCS